MADASQTLFYAGAAAIVAGTVTSLFPLWASRTLSPAAVQRRCYWTGAVVGTVLLFAAVLPDWRSAVFVSLCAALVLVVVAYRFTAHIRLNGRVYAYMRDPRQPDPPPALKRDDD